MGVLRSGPFAFVYIPVPLPNHHGHRMASSLWRSPPNDLWYELLSRWRQDDDVIQSQIDMYGEKSNTYRLLGYICWWCSHIHCLTYYNSTHLGNDANNGRGGDAEPTSEGFAKLINYKKKNFFVLSPQNRLAGDYGIVKFKIMCWHRYLQLFVHIICFM